MKKPAPIFMLLVLAALLCYGLTRLFEIRFAQGNVYAHYSTLRTDGVGSKALYDALAPLLRVQRNYHEPSELHPGDEPSTLFLLGAVYGADDGFDESDLQRLAHDGFRVVVAFHSGPREESSEPEETPKPSPKKKVEKKKPDATPVPEHKQLGVTITYLPNPITHAKTHIAGLEPELSWHSMMYFSALDPAWRTLYEGAGKPVAIERNVGRGSLVLLADSYFSSNEALKKERASGLISALVGNAQTVIFDETHLGTSEHPGTVSLVWKYRLHGVVVALMLVAALFVWRNAVSFVRPADEDSTRQDVVQGTAAATGFISLLKRNIPPYKLMETCLAEWKRSFAHRTKPAVLSRVEAAAAGNPKQPVQVFQTITQILNEKK